MWIEKDTLGNISRYFSPDVTTLPAGYDPAEWEWTDEDVVEIDGKLYLASQAPPPTPEQQQAAIAQAVTARLTDFAAERGWDTLDRALGQTGAFAADAAIVQAAYDQTWLAALAIFDDVEAGQRAMPRVEEFLAELPELRWPEEAEPEEEAEE